MKTPRHGFVSERPAEDWEHALIAGNGSIGALVFGDAAKERIILNRAGLFMPFWAPVPTVPTRDHLPELRDLLRRGEYQRAAERVIEIDNEHDRAGDRWTDPLVPACELSVSCPNGEARSYSRSVDFEQGLVTVQFETERGHCSRRLFASRADAAIVLSIRAPLATLDYDLTLQETPPGSAEELERRRDGIASVETSAGDGWLRYRSRFRKSWPGSLLGHAASARVVTTGGVVTANGAGLQVRGASEILVFLGVELERAPDANPAAALESLLRALPPSFEQLLARHAEIHRGLFHRMTLDLGGRDHALPTERLLARAHPEKLDPTLLEKQFDAARYAILSSSGELPPTLQGMWSGTYCPPWSGDYTHNGNVPTAMAAALCTNQAECLEPLLRYHWSKLADYRQNAERLYGCRGVYVPSRTSSHGLMNHFGPIWAMTFWTGGAGWVAHFFYEYYSYTRDLVFLRERALPFMREVLQFYEDFLQVGASGRLSFNPSYSPENTPGGGDSQACIDATMDLAIARELCLNLIEACAAAGETDDTQARCHEILARLPDYRICADGALAEWLPPELAENHEHRHLSHLYALYDGMPPEIEQQPGLRRAFAVALERRLGERRRAGGGIMAFGLAQIGMVAVSLGDSAICQEVLGLLSAKYFRNSLVSTHDPGALFNVDICGGFPAMLTRCLVDSWPGRIELLKALPPALLRGSLAGARCRGGVQVEHLEWSPERVEVELASGVTQSVVVRLGLSGFRLANASTAHAARDAELRFTLAPKVPLTLVWLREASA